MKRDTTLSVRLSKPVRDALVTISEMESRSVGREIEAMVRAKARRLGIEIVLVKSGQRGKREVSKSRSE